ncbi:gametocyte-specific factor 1 [Rhinophrynus dorsalis]
MDSDGLLQCPYDKNHMIRPSRFPYHLVKCRENNPAMAKVLATCPYNARHRMPKTELQLHMSTCENKVPIAPLPAVIMHQEEEYSTWERPPCEENWDDEDPRSVATPFVLNEFTTRKPYSGSEDLTAPQMSNPGMGIVRREKQVNGKNPWSKNQKTNPATADSKTWSFSTSKRWPRTETSNQTGHALNDQKPLAANGNPWSNNWSKSNFSGPTTARADPKVCPGSSEDWPRLGSDCYKQNKLPWK